MEVTQENWPDVKAKIVGREIGQSVVYENAKLALCVGNETYEFSRETRAYLRSLRGEDAPPRNLRSLL